MLRGWIVLFCQYRYLAVEYLLIAILNSCNSTWVNEKLDLSTSHYLDVNHADIMAWIDLTEWETNPRLGRYLTFLKGRIGRKVADFFMDFLAAAEGLDSKAQNRGLLQAIDNYCIDAQLDKNESQSYRQQVYSYCHEQHRVGEEIVLQELPVLNEKNFQQFSGEQGYNLEGKFLGDRSILRQLTKFSGSGGMSINFDALLLGKQVFWDAGADTLTIKGTPPNLRDQLQRSERGQQVVRVKAQSDDSHSQ